MNFESKRDKIRVMYINSSSISNAIDLENKMILSINNSILKSQVYAQSWKSFQILDSGWKQVNRVYNGYGDGQYYEYYSWEFDFQNFPKRFLPFVKTNFLTKDGQKYVLVDEDYFRKASVWTIEKEEENNVNATLHCHIAFRRSDSRNITELVPFDNMEYYGFLPQYQVRLLVTIQNPEIYAC